VLRFASEWVHEKPCQTSKYGEKSYKDWLEDKQAELRVRGPRKSKKRKES
jgi:hypothetical protein